MNTQKNTRLGSVMLLAIIGSTLGAISAPAQNVPASARQAAASPQFAPRLTHPGAPQHRVPVRHRAGSCNLLHGDGRYRTLPLDQTVYDNGPVNGEIDAWTINFGSSVSDTIEGNATVTGIQFWAWVEPGDTVSSVEVQIGSTGYFSNDLFDGTVTLTQSNCFTNGFGFDVCLVSGNFTGARLSGNDWITLANANTLEGNPVYWDENSGVGCQSPGCPSLAQENTLGTIPSEAFTLTGGPNQNTCMPEQSGAFKVIHDFSGAGDGASPTGVAIDNAGNLYGPTQGAQDGTVYKLAQAGTGWVLNNLYNFAGGFNGGNPQGLIVGPQGILYGAAGGGIQNCGSGGTCGLVYDLRPAPTACLSASCGWTENVLYRFSGSTDASQGGGLVSDLAGNLYGVSYSGGAQQQGDVFQLTPSIAGWVETILYTFTGGSDGGSPTDVLVGNDGNLYGMAEWGGAYSGGVVFQLTRSGNGWSETVLYSLPRQPDFGTNPHSLLQDRAGNLFGEYQYEAGPGNRFGVVFMLTPSGGNWIFTELHHGDEGYDGADVFANLILDAAGNLWGTGGGFSGCYDTIDHGYIFELVRTNNGWQYSTRESWNQTYFDTGGTLALDAHGNLYGTTSDCGVHNQGTVWEFSSTQ